MKTLQIDDNTARSLYPSAPQELKTILESSFGKEFFSMNIIDRTPDLAAVFAIAGTTLENLISEKDDKIDIATKVIKLVNKVLNEGHKHAWSKSTDKWVPIYTNKGSELVFRVASVWFTGTYVPSHLCFKNSDLVNHAVKIAADYYSTYFNEQN